MAVDLFSLRANFEVAGTSQGVSALREIDNIGRQTAAALRGMGNDARLATADFLSGKIGVSDYKTALSVAGEQAIGLSGKLRGAGTVASGVFRGMGDALGTLRSKFTGLGSAISSIAGSPLTGLIAGLTLVRQISAANDAYDTLIKSNLALAGAARNVGAPLASLQKVAAQVRQEFQTSTPVANNLVFEFAKLAQKAGDLNLMTPALRNFLTVGAQMGMSAEETLFRVHQAIVGIDEGTDNLFRKNPSVIYKDYAQNVLHVTRQLTSQEQALALLHEAQVVANRDQDAYGRFLETVLGKQGAMNAKLFEAQARFGEAIAPMRLFIYGIGTSLANALASATVRFQRGFGDWKAIFTQGLPGVVKVGAGAVLGVLASLVSGASALLSKLGINLGSGLAASLTSAAAALSQSGSAQLAAVSARLQETSRLADAASGSGAVDMSPVDFPNLPPTPPGSGELTDRQRRRLLDALKYTRPKSLPGGGSFGGPLAIRGDLAGPGGKPFSRFSKEMLDEATKALNEVEDHFRSFGTKLSQTFSGAIEAAFSSKHPLKAFGKSVLAGLGSIFSSMGKAMIAASPLFIALNKAMHNPFTSGFALLAMGGALVALGSTLGGIATDKGGSGSSSAPKDQVTRITLTAPGAGGLNAPEVRPSTPITIIGPDDLGAQRQITKLISNAKRRGY